MLKFLFLLFALLTVLFNGLLTYYIYRDKKYGRSNYSSNRKVVSFDLSRYASAEEAAATEVLETEVIASYNKRE